MDVFLGIVAAFVGMFVFCWGLSCLISRLWWHPYLLVDTARPTTDQVILARAKTAELDADWREVRKMEWAIYGAYYHRMDGTTNAAGWEPVPPDEARAAEQRYLSQFEQALDKVGERTYSNRIRAAEIRQQGMGEEAEMDKAWVESKEHPGWYVIEYDWKHLS